MQYDHARRTLPRINVLRGWPGNETTSLTHTAKPKLNEGIKSGMVIVLDDNGQWIQATTSLSAKKLVYWATADQADTDVVSAGLLLGLSVAGNYEIQTPYYKTDDVYTANPSALKVHSVGGYLALATDIADKQWEIVGMVTRGGLTSLSGINSESSGTSVLNFVTFWRPAHA